MLNFRTCRCLDPWSILLLEIAFGRQFWLSSDGQWDASEDIISLGWHEAVTKNSIHKVCCTSIELWELFSHAPRTPWWYFDGGDRNKEIDALRDWSLVLIRQDSYGRCVDRWMNFLHKLPKLCPVACILVAKHNSKGQWSHVTICRSSLGGQ